MTVESQPPALSNSFGGNYLVGMKPVSGRTETVREYDTNPEGRKSSDPIQLTLEI